MSEVWVSVPSYEGLYEVSSYGNVRSLGRTTRYPAGGIREFPSRLLVPRDARGYCIVSLTGETRKVLQVSVHTLVATAFLGPRPSKIHQVDHINGIKNDNRLVNLEWVTNSENMKRAHNIGLVKNKCKGVLINSARLTEEKVKKIVSMNAYGMKKTDIARELNVVPSTVTSICRGQTWGWLTGIEKKRHKRA